MCMHDDLATNSNVLTAFNDAITYAMVTHPNEIEITTPRALLAPYQ
jgi:hypothetical protein